MNVDNIQALIAQKKTVLLADIIPAEAYVQLGVFQTGNRQNGAGNANAYAPYVISVAELLTGIVPVPVANNGLFVAAGAVKLGGTLLQNTGINVAGFNLTISTGANLSANFTNRTLADSSNIGALSWNLRQLNDSTGVASALWDLRILSDSTANNSLDWDARVLYNPTGVAVLNWTGTLAAVQVSGITAAAGAYAFRAYNSTPADLFSIENNGTVTIQGGNGFNGTLEVHQRVGTTHILSVYNTSFAKQMVLITDNAGAGGISMGAGMLNLDAYGGGLGINIGAPSVGSGTLLRINRSLAGADTFAVTGMGNGGFYVSDTANDARVYMQDAAAATKVLIHTNGASFFNGGKVSMTALPAGSGGLATGDLYVDTAANILANGDKVVGWKV